MIEIPFNLFTKKDFFRLIFCVLLCVYICENGFAQKFWNRDYVAASYLFEQSCIAITTGVYDYSFGPNSEHGYLAYCCFEASVDNKIYFKLMEIETPKQSNTKTTKMIFKKKLAKAKIIFLNDILHSQENYEWPGAFRHRLNIMVPTHGNVAGVILKWILLYKYEDVRFIRISGIWRVDGHQSQIFKDVIYEVNNPKQNELNTYAPISMKTKSEKNAVNIYKNLEAVFIKGADLGSNIKIYSTSGVEIKSVISNEDVVKTKLHPKQMYIVHIGNSRYKASL